MIKRIANVTFIWLFVISGFFMTGEYSLFNKKSLAIASETDARLSKESSEGFQVLENPSNYSEDEILNIEISELEDEISRLSQQILSKKNDLMLKNLEKEKKAERQRTVEREPCKGCKIKKLLLKPENLIGRKSKTSQGETVAVVTARENLEKITLTYVVEPENCTVNFTNIQYQYITVYTGIPVTGKRSDQFSPLITTKSLPGGYKVDGNSITFFIDQINKAARNGTGDFDAGILTLIAGVFKCECCGKVTVTRFAIEITD